MPSKQSNKTLSVVSPRSINEPILFTSRANYCGKKIILPISDPSSPKIEVNPSPTKKVVRRFK